MRRLLLAVALGGLLAAQVLSGSRPSYWSDQQVSPPAPSPQSASPAAHPQAALAQADAIFEQMSRLTGLPIKAPLKKRIVSRPEIEKYLVINLHADYTPQQIHVQEASLRAFGLVSGSFDLEKFLVSFYTEQAAGFYDPRTKTMYLADWVPAATQQMVLSHELTHALQDQNFDLLHYMHAVKSDDDAESARQAVVEGYATAAMFQRMLGGTSLTLLPPLESLIGPALHQQMDEYPVFSKAPLFFRLEALFPYVDGATFIQRALKETGGWTGLNTLFTSPPDSTKAVYQPETYFRKVLLPKIGIPKGNPLDSVPELNHLDANSLGELGVNELLGQFLSEERANLVSPEWLGDRYILYENHAKQSYALVARARWTNSEAALTFFRDYHAILVQKYVALAPDSASTPECFIGRTSAGDVILLRAGNEVRWAEGVPAGKVPEMVNWLQSL